MYRSSGRTRRLTLRWLGICGAVLLLGWPGGSSARTAELMSLTAAGRPTAVGTGALMVSPGSATASAATMLTFTYTADLLDDGTLTLTVPQGWTPPSQTPGPGYTTVSCPAAIPSAPPCQLTVSSSAMTITVSNAYRDVDFGQTTTGSTIIAPAGNLAPGQTFTISYGPVQAPAAQAYLFGAQEQSAQDGTLTTLSGPPPTVTVTPATVPPPPPGGAGMITVSPARAVAGRASTLRFTYTAAGGGLPATGAVVVQVPAGWTAPSRTQGQAGYASSRAGLLSVSGRRITVTGVALLPGQQLIITYTAGIAPRLPGSSAFVTSEQPDGTVRLAALAQSPSVTVVPVGGPPVRRTSSQGLLLLIGLAIVAVAAGVLVAHLLRRRAAQLPPRGGGQAAAGGSVRAVPRTGPPATLAVRDVGRRPTLTVRIEPHASTAVTTIKEARP